ncbi:MAG TPA: hypothetical protein VGF67_09470 [Ktedonobacteraceae bacterium]
MIGDDWLETSIEAATENALGKLYGKALQLQADGVIGIQIGVHGNVVTVIGTAIAFLDDHTWPQSPGNDLILQ